MFTAILGAISMAKQICTCEQKEKRWERLIVDFEGIFRFLGGFLTIIFLSDGLTHFNFLGFFSLQDTGGH